MIFAITLLIVYVILILFAHSAWPGIFNDEDEL